MTFSLKRLGFEDGEHPCLVRDDDGAFIPLRDADVMLELMRTDTEAYVALMTLAHNLVRNRAVSLHA